MDTQTPSRSLAERLRARPLLTGGVAVALLAVLAVVVFWFEPQALFIDDVVDEAFPTVEPEEPDAAADAEADQAEQSDGDDEVAGAAEQGDAAGDAGVAGTAEREDAAGEAGEEPSGSDAKGGEGDAAAEPAEPVEPAEPAEPIALATGSFEGRNDYSVAGSATFYELPDGSRTLRFEDFVSDNGPDLYVYLTSSDSADPDAVIDDDIVDLGVLTGNIGNQNYTIPADVDLERYDTVLIWCLRFTAGFGTADLVAS